MVLMVAVKNGRTFRAKSERVADWYESKGIAIRMPKEAEPEDEEKPEKPKRTYRRRDMKAED